MNFQFYVPTVNIVKFINISAEPRSNMIEFFKFLN